MQNHIGNPKNPKNPFSDMKSRVGVQNPYARRIFWNVWMHNAFCTPRYLIHATHNYLVHFVSKPLDKCLKKVLLNFIGNLLSKPLSKSDNKSLCMILGKSLTTSLNKPFDLLKDSFQGSLKACLKTCSKGCLRCC